MDLYLTVDVEVWCDGWNDLDAKFASCFRQYIYGSTTRGDYGLPHQLRVLRKHDLRAIFFAELLFSARFGALCMLPMVMFQDGLGRLRRGATVGGRFERLCAFLARHRDSIRLRSFDTHQPALADEQPPPLRGSLLPTVGRMAEQVLRRLYSRAAA